MGTWSMWTLARTGTGGDPILAEVVVRVKYFYVVTLVLNVICSRMSPLSIIVLMRAMLLLFL
jgi:hypothetical protein